MTQARPDLQITGIDVRRCDRAATVILGDVLTHDFPPASFDAIVFISSLEHIGLGAYGDPIDPDGDTKAMARARTWVRTDGLVYFDVPYSPQYTLVKGKWRRYDDANLRRRVMTGWTEIAREVQEPKHPDAPYLAVIAKAA